MTPIPKTTPMILGDDPDAGDSADAATAQDGAANPCSRGVDASRLIITDLPTFSGGVTSVQYSDRVAQGSNATFSARVAPVAEGLSYDLEVWTPIQPEAQSYVRHSLRTNVDAKTTDPHLAFGTLAPNIELLSMPGPDRCLSKLEWTAHGDEANADAVVIVIGNSYAFTSCCAVESSWVIIVPPETRSLDLSFLDELHSPTSVPRSYALYQISYIDAEHQHGYREFLREPLRIPSAYAGVGPSVRPPSGRCCASYRLAAACAPPALSSRAGNECGRATAEREQRA